MRKLILSLLVTGIFVLVGTTATKAQTTTAPKSKTVVEKKITPAPVNKNIVPKKVEKLAPAEKAVKTMPVKRAETAPKRETSTSESDANPPLKRAKVANQGLKAKPIAKPEAEKK